MRKVLVVFLAIMLVLSGCDSVAEPSDPGVVSSPESSEPTTEVLDNSNEMSIPVKLTAEHVAEMQEYLSNCKYIVFMQEMENGLQGQAVYSLTRYNLSVNLEQKMQSVSMRYIQVNGINRDGVGYKMITDGERILVSEDGVWVEADGMYETVAWDLSQFENAWDVFTYLLHDIELPVGKNGYVVDNYWTFEFTEQANDTLLAGIEYDDLLDATYKFTFRVREEKLTPDSITVRVGYKVGDEEYYVSSTIQMNSYGNTKIAMPEVGDAS